MQGVLAARAAQAHHGYSSSDKQQQEWDDPPIADLQSKYAQAKAADDPEEQKQSRFLSNGHVPV
ncbi:MAG: hypothetical protein AAF495_04535 [Pseudomonadota bacterium]